jgi:hypothetical protein
MIAGKQILEVIVVPGKLVNIVLRSRSRKRRALARLPEMLPWLVLSRRS